MKVTLERIIPFDLAFRELESATLEAAGEEKVFVYKGARIRIGELHADEVNPTSLYLLKENLELQTALRAALLDQFQIDTLRLPGVLHLRKEDGSLVGMIPPYVEISEESVNLIPKPGDRQCPCDLVRVPIVVDGLHRAWIAREKDLPFVAVIASNTVGPYPHYAYPNRWDDVKIYDKVPPIKKHYRRQDPYSFMLPLDILRRAGQADFKPEYGR